MPSTENVGFDEPMEYHLETDSKLIRIYCAAIREGPTKQASLEGAKPYHVVTEAVLGVRPR